jgi:hypothetical protein
MTATPHQALVQRIALFEEAQERKWNKIETAQLTAIRKRMVRAFGGQTVDDSLKRAFRRAFETSQVGPTSIGFSKKNKEDPTVYIEGEFDLSKLAKFMIIYAA